MADDCARSRSPGSASGGRPPPHSTDRLTLRAFLGDKASAAFQKNGVADVPVSTFEIDARLSAMQKALVAHDAINRSLSNVGATEMPDKLLTSIEKAEQIGILDVREVRWLKSINKQANEAKHGKGLPF